MSLYNGRELVDFKANLPIPTITTTNSTTNIAAALTAVYC